MSVECCDSQIANEAVPLQRTSSRGAISGGLTAYCPSSPGRRGSLKTGARVGPITLTCDPRDP